MSPDTWKPRPGLCGHLCVRLSQEETVFSCTQNQGFLCKKHGGMDAGVLDRVSRYTETLLASVRNSLVFLTC